MLNRLMMLFKKQSGNPLSEMYWKQLAEEIRILYGGSVKGSNAREYFSQSEIDGALVGGAALTTDFINIVEAAAF